MAPGAGAPLHVQIERWLGSVIERADLVPGDKLPRLDDLAAALGVSRMTLRQAVATLEGHGVLESRRGRIGGTYVTEPRIEADLTSVAGFTEQVRRASLRAGARMVSAQTMPAKVEAARALGLARGDDVHEVVRVRTVRREPTALERATFPAAVFPDLLSHRLGGSLYELMRREYGHQPHWATEVLEPVAAGADEARLLGVAAGTPLLAIERTTYTASGLAVEYAWDLFRPDRIRVSFRTGFGGATREASLESRQP
jgi:GntR family transcriptional regulator